MDVLPAAVVPQRGRPKDEAQAARRRESILRGAIAHFAKSGYANAELDAIAADLGCAKGTLYHYFPSKSDLFAAAVDLVMRDLLAATTFDESLDPIERMEQSIRSFLAFFDAHPEYVELLIQERAEFRDRKRPSYFEYRDVHCDRCKAEMRKLMEAGRVRAMPIERAMDAIGDRLYGTIFVNYFAGRRQTLEQQAADVLDVLFRGLLTPDEAARWREGKDQ